MWEVEYTDQFGEWWNGLTAEEQKPIIANVELLAAQQRGHDRGRVELQTRDRERRVQRMLDIGVAGGARLTVVCMLGERVCLFDQRQPVGRQILAGLLEQRRDAQGIRWGILKCNFRHLPSM